MSKVYDMINDMIMLNDMFMINDMLMTCLCVYVIYYVKVYAAYTSSH